MRILAALLLSSAFSQVEAIPEVEGKTLPPVPGPMTGRDLIPSRGTRHGSIEGQMRHQARGSASIPAVAVPDGPISVKDRIGDLAGWKAYRVEVAPKGRIHARLTGDHEAWFIVKAVNRWGQLEPGMLQNRIPTGNPEASYLNPKAEKATVYFVVDTTELSMIGEAFKLTFTVK